MKTILFIFLLLLKTASTWSQSEWGMSYQLKTGFLAAHKGEMAMLPEQIAWASEFSYFKHLHQKDSWIESYKDPTVGATLFLGSVGNNDVLGRYLALYGFAELPILVKKNFELDWKFGTGLGLTNRKYDSIFNPLNIAIGSHVNMMVVMALNAQYRFQRNSISLGLDLTHFSNSAFQVPNLGINIPSISLGYSRKINSVKKTSISVSTLRYKKIYFGGLGIFSLKELMPYGVRKFPIYAATIFSRVIFNAKAGVELGFDLISNQAHFDFEPLVDKTQWSILQLGVYAAYLVPLNRVHFMFGMGSYVRDWYVPDGLLYHRIGFRYQGDNGLFSHVAIKSHWAKADYLELGIGYLLNARRSNKKEIRLGCFL